MDDPERIYHWLVKDDIYYHHALGIMVKLLHLAVKDKKGTVANAYIEELKSICEEVGDDLEKALISLECARAIFKLGDHDAAIDELNHAIVLLEPRADDTTDHKHYYAVAKWMLGSLLKQSPNKRKEAIVAWQNSLDAFENLIFLTGYYSWYDERRKIMYEKIESMVKERTLDIQRFSTQRKKKIEKYKLPISTLYSGDLSYLDIVGMIPAGGFSPSSLDSYFIERLSLNPEMNEFIINGKLHKLYNFRKDDHIITLVSTENYFILQVLGDSMNEAFINPGDYVLMREQNNAENGNIVAAEIIKEDNQASLKFFTKNKSDIVLRPRSTNKIHKEYRFTDSEQGFFIRGVALGVIKPVKQEI